MEKYDHKAIESAWQRVWQEEMTFATPARPGKLRAYVLDMFPYPSAQGLHVGHPEGYTATDIYCRYLRMKGVSVLHPMGWDAFGLPAENYAIKTQRHPSETTAENIANIKKQIESLGFSYDWSRELSTADPKYYRWTQWLFLQLYKKGLAYRTEAPVNWCPGCQTVLANEQVVDGKCERCQSTVEQRQMKQWFFKITDYAEQLLNDLKDLDWPPPIVEMQKNWIGKSEGAEVEFRIMNKESRIVLVHGKDTHPKGKKWYLWLNDLTKEYGGTLIIPELPKPKDPVLQEWMQVIEKIHPDENTVLIGHSRGGVAIMRWLENAPQDVKVKKVILVAANSGDSEKGGSFYEDGSFDYAKIKQHSNEFVVLHSKDDEWVGFESGVKNTQGLNARFYELDGRGHFGHKVDHIPELEKELFLKIKVFTTRLDTIFGATFMVISPELAKKWLQAGWQASDQVKNYVSEALKGRELERLERAAKEKTGVDTGMKAINPATGEEIPVWVADYVLGSYGTGAIMAVPAHDERDFAFARRFHLPVKIVVAPPTRPFALILHGTGANSKKNWYMWLAKELDQRGYEVAVPDLPDSELPDLDKWMNALGRYVDKLNEQTLLVGHSLGAPAVLNFLQRANKVVGQVVLVAPTSPSKDWSKIEATHEPNQAKHIRAFTGSPINWHEVRTLSRSFVSIFSDNDPYIELNTKAIFERNLGSVTRVFSGRGHFSERTAGTVSLPEFFEVFPVAAKDDDGVLVNSGKFDDLSSGEAKHKIAKKIGAELKTQYKLHDWLISRQRYWGAPIPIIYCENCARLHQGFGGQGEVPVPEKDLPVILPDDVDFRPHGESPLARSQSFQEAVCPKCGAPAKRESDTMDTFVDSSWYFLRYCDPNNDAEIFDKKKVKEWCPVNFYVGGAEHAVMHLLYARFFTKVLRGLGYLKFDEPFLKLRNQGLILGEDGQKMSKSRGNVVNPDEIVAQYGADTFRLYEMFLGPLEEAKPWNTNSIIGLRRFLERVWRLVLWLKINNDLPLNQEAKTELGYWVAKTTKKVTDDVEDFRFNTAIAALMEFTNYLQGVTLPPAEQVKALSVLLRLIYPFAPHLASELWQRLGRPGRVWQQPWPVYDPKALKQEQVTYVVQVNGKVRGQIIVSVEAKEAEVVAAAQSLSQVARHLTGKRVVKTVYVPSRLVNFVVE